MAHYTNADLQEALSILADYCPSACIEFARVCRAGQRQHNGGVPGLFHDRTKSPENFEKGIGHWSRRGKIDEDGTLHVAKAFWRAGIDCQLECESRGEPIAPAARNLPPAGPVPEGVAAAYLRDNPISTTEKIPVVETPPNEAPMPLHTEASYVEQWCGALNLPATDTGD